MKDYREREIKYLLIVYVLLLLLWCTGIFDNFANTDITWSSLFSAIEGITISGVLSLITFVGDSLFSSNQKDKLLGLFFIPKPGNTLFTRISNGKVIDDRFTCSEASERYYDIICKLPTDKKEKMAYENANWYKIYHKYKEVGSINQSQRDYLICRDLYVQSIIFIVFYLIAAALFTDTIFFSGIFVATIIVMTVIANIAAHKKMNRFVNNVIAIDIAENS